MGKNKRRGVSASRREELEHLEELPWSSSVPDDDPFSILFGPAAALDGGFLSLEEIDEAGYNLAIPDPRKQTEEGSAKVSPEAKKRKQADIGGAQDEGVEIKAEEGVGEEAEVKQNKKKKKKTKAAKQGERPNALATVAETKEEDDEELVDEDGYNAWNELRLHPLLMKAIQKLGFKEPTPIQRACIPAAAHRGKDVIGAAETGSGKTLAFGLPILQRLLDEQEKVEKLMLEDEDAVEKVAPRSLLRALIITPTRELALQTQRLGSNEP